ncbi:MAG: BrnT family toxin [Thermomicrobiales bacterium]
MNFEWDEAKRLSNLAKHGIDFRVGRRLFDGRPVVTIPSPFSDEARFLTTGVVDDLFITVVWTYRADGIRIISARRARNAEKGAHRSLYGG